MQYDDNYYMSLALQEATLAYEADEVPIGAVVVHNNQVIAKGHNMVERLEDSTAHAEIIAITAAEEYLGAKYLSECTLYVTIEPCVMCAGAMYWCKLGRLVYGADEEKYGYTAIAPNALHIKTEVTKGIMADEAKDLIQRFFKNKRRK